MTIQQMLLASAAAAATDPYFANVRLLAHMEGTDTGTTFTDSSSFANTITVPNSNIQTRTTQAKFGLASANCNVTTSTTTYLEVADTTNLEFGANDFCIEAWLYWAAAPTNGAGNFVLSSKLTTTTSQAEHLFYGVGGTTGSLTLYFFWSTTGSSMSNVNSGSFTPSINTWHHIACTRNGNDLRFFVNGTQQGSTQSVTGTIFAGTATWRAIGWQNGSVTINGYMDDLRITVGQARYTANFTPPTTTFPDA
jgi:Concanavalin A-like lectin/glucanases superfamily